MNKILLKKIALICLLVSFLLPLTSHVQAQSQALVQVNQQAWLQDSKLQRYLEYYYITKPVFQTPDMMERLMDTGYLDQTPEQQAIITGFFGAVFKNNQDKVVGWLDSLNGLTQYQAGSFIRALRYAGMQKELGIWITRKGWSYPADTDFSALDFPLTLKAQEITVNNIQSFWGAFIATGDMKAIDTLLTYAKTNENTTLESLKGVKDPVLLEPYFLSQIIQGLLANAGARHDLVLKHLEDKAAGSMKDSIAMKKVIAQVYIIKNNIGAE